MSRRGHAAEHRVRPHVPIADDADCCAICHLPAAARSNKLHLDAPPAVDPDITAEEQRRLGEHDQEDTG